MATILLIEDNKEILENLTEFLELEGFNVITASNGRQGIELAMAFMPGLIICDVLMPEMNGFEVLQLILCTPVISETAFIFSTSKSEKSDKSAAMLLGADDYIVKPYELEYLLKVTNTCIQCGSKRSR